MRAIALVLPALLLASAAADEGHVQLKDGPGKELVVASCAMCHSLDYIPMNSPFLDRKGWEGSINKMIKVMGAPISAEDVPKILEYLAMQYGAGSAGAHAAPAAVRTGGPPPALTPELLARGKASFGTYCAACHGASGAGDGPAAKALQPPPKDLRASTRTAPAVFEVLNTGVKGTAMAPFKHLSEADRWAISHYVESLERTAR